jgi:isochorismate hydrolase
VKLFTNFFLFFLSKKELILVYMTNQNRSRLIESSAALLVIDVQEKLKPVVENWDFLVGRCCRLIQFFKLINAPIRVTEQYPKGLGASVKEICSACADVPALSKTCFSCCGSDELKKSIESVHRKQWILAGIESHVCVLQTAFDLLSMDCEVFVAVDALSSRHTMDHQYAIKRMRDAGVVISTSESLMFEILRDSKHPAFKEASALVKSN